MQPSALIEDLGEIESELGNFGHITYGTNYVGRIYFPTESNHDGCQPFDESQFGVSIPRATIRNQFIIVRRGNCSNPMKVRNIEQFGASLALIVDDRDEDIEDAVMVDHYGSGQSLVTPGFLLSKV